MSVPKTRQVDQVDDYFGTAVPDPYRWLENGADPEVAEWLAAQAAATRDHLDALPGRAAIVAALDRAVRLPHSGLPVHRGASWFRTANDGVQQQDVLLVSDDPFGPARVLVDPNALGGDGSTSLAEWAPSPDGTMLAYSYRAAGSDWRTWRIREVASGTDRADEIAWSKFTDPQWLPDGSGVVYGRFDPPSGDEFVAANSGQRVELHRVGTTQDDDLVLLALPDEPDVTFWPQITHDGRWLVVIGTRGTELNGRIWVGDLTADELALRLLVPDEVASWELVGSAGAELLMLTDLDAPRNRLVALDTGRGTVRELIAERDDRLEAAVLAGGRVVASWLHDAASQVTVHDLDGTQSAEVPLAGLGSVLEMSARAGEPLVHLAWSSFTEPTAVLSYDVAAARLDTAFATPLGSRLVTEQIRVTSADGTTVPVFLIHRADVTIESGPHPTWLFGYGGFRIPITPQFEPTRYCFAEAGGVVAVACLRGGGEFGASWHDDGRRANKQHVFDDAIATAEHLIATGWTDRHHLGLSGRSNGGLLAGAVLTQRPDLFAAVVPEVGVLDMLRFPLWTIGWGWVSDYGDPRADEEQFRTLLAYSPLHNLRPDAGYPPVLVLTSDHDDRVVPAHSLKFTARLQEVTPPDAVALLRVETNGGHGLGRSHDALIAERADVLAFLARYTGLVFG
jgi:prolyl oligopeptidase